MDRDCVQDDIFLIGVAALILRSLFGTSEILQLPDYFDKLWQGIFLICMLFKLAHQVYTKVSFFVTVGVLCLAAIICIQAKYYTVFYTTLTIMSVQGVDIKRVLKVTYRLKITFLIYQTVGYFLIYYLDPWRINFVLRDMESGLRHTFLFGHPNTYSCYIVWTCMEYIYVNYEKISYLQLAVIWLINTIVHHFTDSNTAYLVTIALIVLIVLDKACGDKLEKVLNLLARYGFALCCVLFIWLVSGYVRFQGVFLDFFMSVNEFLTGRLLYGAYTYDVYGMTLFGRVLHFAKKTYWRGYWLDSMVFDNVYIQMYLFYGVVLVVGLSVLFILVGKKFTRIENIIFCLWIFYGVTEAYIMDLAICFPLIYVGAYLCQQKEQQDTIVLENDRGVALWQLK